MEIIKNVADGKLSVALKGRLDTTTAPQLQEAIEVEINQCKEAVLDFAELEYISSAGLRVVLSSFKTVSANGGSLSIINASAFIKEVFDITGLSDVISIK